MNEYYVYIMASKTRRIYTGMTNNLHTRVYQHKQRSIKGFTSRYNITRLVYFETSNDVNEIIHREKQIKGWKRDKKIALIESENPNWDDLSDGWY